ncbi:hypothetical protein SeLEV6574_g08170 [Synchytrium endobioticum]|uniref:Wbp11/ELF5/Saf1 N-terminal domain-containing protein n=1 Tax=Synchytrium endobioticum TaxID=286115 RepID=A0A507C8F5_9FUNG|nr:hypothetical protein SeLEV6574_g08170 [Synchytrium endobioticum]
MAKGRALNPADAHRRAERKKELKKNKQDRKQVRLIAIATKDVRKIDAELALLRQQERQGKLEYKSLLRKKEITALIKKRQDAREKLGLKPDTSTTTTAPPQPSTRPQDSPHYHPVYNPYGAPPPGAVPEKEKLSVQEPLKLAEGQEPEDDDEEEDDESEHSSDPSSDDEQDEDDVHVSQEDLVPTFDDLTKLPMPKGPPPDTKAHVYSFIDAPETRHSADYVISKAPKPAVQSPVPQQPQQQHRQFPPPPPPFYQPAFSAGPPYRPPPHPMYFTGGRPLPMPYYGALPPPLPPPGYPPVAAAGNAPFAYPPIPPRGMMPPYPIPFNSNIPMPLPSGMMEPPPGPVAPSSPKPPMPTNSAPSAQAVKTAAPMVRDLHKELTKFVPPSLLRKRNVPSSTKVNVPSKVDNENNQDESVQPPAAKKLITGRNVNTNGGTSMDNDYDKFMKEMEGLL